MRYALTIPLLWVLVVAGGTQAASDRTPKTSLTPVIDRTPAPNFTLPDLSGNALQLSTLKGKVVLVNFWATWCAPCRKEMPSLNRLWEKLTPHGVQVIAVDVGEQASEVRAFLTELAEPLGFPIVFDQTMQVVTQWRIKGLPTTVLIDKRGRMAYTALGDRDWDAPDIVDVVRQLAAE